MKRALAWIVRIVGLTAATLFCASIFIFFALYFWAILSSFGLWTVFLGVLLAAAGIFCLFLFLCGFITAWDWSKKHLDKR